MSVNFNTAAAAPAVPAVVSAVEAAPAVAPAANAPAPAAPAAEAVATAGTPIAAANDPVAVIKRIEGDAATYIAGLIAKVNKTGANIDTTKLAVSITPIDGQVTTTDAAHGCKCNGAACACHEKKAAEAPKADALVQAPVEAAKPEVAAAAPAIEQPAAGTTAPANAQSVAQQGVATAPTMANPANQVAAPALHHGVAANDQTYVKSA